VESVRELGAEKHLSDKVQINVACDGIAGEASERFISDPTQALPPTLQPPYSGSKAMFKIGDIWITSNYDKNIHLASTALRDCEITEYDHHGSGTQLTAIVKTWDGQTNA
jgi:hypothetical protein